MNSIQVKQKVIQLCNAQDGAYTGTAVHAQTGETYHYGIIIDGHGSNKTVRKIRNIIDENIDDILVSDSPHIIIQSKLDEMYQQDLVYCESLDNNIFFKNLEYAIFSGGSTFLLSKLYENRVEVFSIGDSKAYVMINNEIAYHNLLHVWNNESEKTRLLARTDVCATPIMQSFPHIISPERMAFEKSVAVEYTNANGNSITRLVPTQSLGHNSITQFAPEKMTIPFDPTDAVKIVLASDGLWDVFVPHHPDDAMRLMEMNGEELADLAESRWKQEWEVAVDITHPDNLYQEKSTFPENSYDDIAVITMIRNPRVNV
jgi:serine/threonine protein phosphatase PrpC